MSVSLIDGHIDEPKKCEYCEALTEEHRHGFMLPTTDPDCDFIMVTIKFCPMCGRELKAR